MTTVAGFFDDCLLLAERLPPVLARRLRPLQPARRAGLGRGIDKPVNGYHAALAGTPTNPLDEVGLYQATSDVLPPASSRSSRPATSPRSSASPEIPSLRSRARTSPRHCTRTSPTCACTRTIDLTGVTAADAPNLQFQLSYNTEEGFDHVIVEAHTRAPTTGRRCLTSTADAASPPAECEQGFLLDLHPFLRHYLTAEPLRRDGQDRGLELVHRLLAGLEAGRRSTSPPMRARRSSCRSAT